MLYTECWEGCTGAPALDLYCAFFQDFLPVRGSLGQFLAQLPPPQSSDTLWGEDLHDPFCLPGGETAVPAGCEVFETGHRVYRRETDSKVVWILKPVRVFINFLMNRMGRMYSQLTSWCQGITAVQHKRYWWCSLFVPCFIYLCIWKSTGISEHGCVSAGVANSALALGFGVRHCCSV